MKRGLLSMAAGLLAIVVGLAVSFGSYAAVSQKGGHYVVAWGAVVFGGVAFVRGLFWFLRALVAPDGRKALGRLLWPQSGAGWAVRLSLVVAAAAITWFVAPDAWKTMSPASLRTLQGTDDIKAVAYAPSGQWIAVGMGYGGLKLFNVATGQEGKAPSLDSTTDVDAVAFSPDGRLLAAATGSGLKIWASADWQRTAPTLVGTAQEGRYAVAFSPDGRSIATGSVSRGVLVWDARNATLKWKSDTRDSIMAVAFSRDGRFIASGHDYGEVKLWQAATGTLVRTLHVDGAWEPVTTLAFFHDGRLAAGSYRRPGVAIWESGTGALLRTLHGTTSRVWPAGHVWSLAISPDDRWIVSGNTDRSVRFWNATSDDPVRTIFGHRKDVLSVAFSPDGQQFASGSSDKIINIWTNSP